MPRHRPLETYERVYVEVKDEHEKVLRAFSLPAEVFRVDTRKRTHNAGLIGTELFKTVREAALIILKRKRRMEDRICPPARYWRREHERNVWHYQEEDWVMRCGTVIPGSPPSSILQPTDGEICDDCRSTLEIGELETPLQAPDTDS